MLKVYVKELRADTTIRDIGRAEKILAAFNRLAGTAA